VIGDDVEHLPEIGSPQRLGESSVSRRSAELAIHRARVDDVVAVHAAFRGLQVRRAVHVAHAERREIVGDRRGRGEVEAGVELNAVGGAELSGHVSADGQSACLDGPPVPCGKASPGPKVEQPG